METFFIPRDKLGRMSVLLPHGGDLADTKDSKGVVYGYASSDPHVAVMVGDTEMDAARLADLITVRESHGMLHYTANPAHTGIFEYGAEDPTDWKHGSPTFITEMAVLRAFESPFKNFRACGHRRVLNHYRPSMLSGTLTLRKGGVYAIGLVLLESSYKVVIECMSEWDKGAVPFGTWRSERIIVVGFMGYAPNAGEDNTLHLNYMNNRQVIANLHTDGPSAGIALYEQSEQMGQMRRLRNELELTGNALGIEHNFGDMLDQLVRNAGAFAAFIIPTGKKAETEESGNGTKH